MEATRRSHRKPWSQRLERVLERVQTQAPLQSPAAPGYKAQSSHSARGGSHMGTGLDTNSARVANTQNKVVVLKKTLVCSLLKSRVNECAGN